MAVAGATADCAAAATAGDFEVAGAALAAAARPAAGEHGSETDCRASNDDATPAAQGAAARCTGGDRKGDRGERSAACGADPLRCGSGPGRRAALRRPVGEGPRDRGVFRTQGM